MFTPAPIDKNFVPYTRPVLMNNAGLFVDGAAGKCRGRSRVAPQTSVFVDDPCYRKPQGWPCGAGKVCNEYSGDSELGTPPRMRRA